jgi:hypothetical protein
VLTTLLSSSSSSSSSGELVRRRLVSLVVRASNDGRGWPRRRDFLGPLEDGVDDSGSDSGRSKSDLGICIVSLHLSHGILRAIVTLGAAFCSLALRKDPSSGGRALRPVRG